MESEKTTSWKFFLIRLYRVPDLTYTNPSAANLEVYRYCGIRR